MEWIEAGRRSLCCIALITLVLAAAPANQTQPINSLPDSIEGKRLAAFLAAVEANTEEAMREFVVKNFSAKDLERLPVEPRLRRLYGFAREASPLKLRKFLGSSPQGPAALFRSGKTGNWFEIRLALTPDPAREVIGVDIEDSDATALEPEPVFRSDQDVAKAADAYLSRLAREGRFAGVALLARHGKPFFQKAYGLADRERKISSKVTTRFNIGSINKIFTQVAIAQLASQGKVSLSETMRKYLPDYPSSAADEITVLQLVNMTSGLGDIFSERYEEVAPRLRTLSDFLNLFADKPLLFPPGQRRQYSNAGYIVLGLIIEKASGKSYHDYVRDHVYAPAGMKASGPAERGVTESDLAVGYVGAGDGGAAKSGLHPNTTSLPGRSSSAGGGLSTAQDLLAFDRALREGKLLPANWTAWIYSDKTAPPSEAGVAAGAGLGVAGGAPGINAALESDDRRGFTVVVLANLDPPAASRSAKKFRTWMAAMASGSAVARELPPESERPN